MILHLKLKLLEEAEKFMNRATGRKYRMWSTRIVAKE